MKFMELTTNFGGKVLVNLATVSEIYDLGGSTKLFFVGDSTNYLTVSDSYDCIRTVIAAA